MKIIPVLKNVHSQGTAPSTGRALRATLCALALISPNVASAGWSFVKVPPRFPPTIPSSASGPVDYQYTFSGISAGDIVCGADTYDHVAGFTREIADVNSVAVSDHITVEESFFGLYPTCRPIQGVSDYSCLQSYDYLTGVFTPAADAGNCNYANGAFLGSVSVQATGSPECWTTVIDHTEGPIVNGVPSWTLDYEHPTYYPLCPYLAIRTCTWADDPNAACHLTVYGSSAYYRIVLHLEQGVSPPVLPSQPQGTIGGRGNACANGGCVLPMATWWPLEGNAVDTVGLNNGTLSGTHYGFSAGQVGQALNLTGANSGVSVPSSSAINFGAGADFSVEAWIAPQSATTTYGVMDIVDKRSTPTDAAALGYELCVVGGKLTFQMSDSLSTAPLNVGPAGPDLRDGFWHHVAVTVQRASSTGGILYIDGQQVTTFNPTSRSGSLVTTQPLLIGMHPSSWVDCNFRGGIDEVSVYGTALSSSQVQAVYQANTAGKPLRECTPVPSGLAAWWPVDASAADLLGVNHGTLVGDAGFTSGEVAAALNLSGPNSGVSVPSSSAINFGAGADFSVEAWIKPQSATTTYGVMDIVDKRSTPSDAAALGYELCVVGGKLTFQMSDSLSTAPLNVGPAGPDLRDGAWHHVAVTVQRASSTGGILYVDGQQVTTFNPTSRSGSLVTTQPLLIGMHPSNWVDCNFRGGIDEVSLYSRALNASEVQSIYRGFAAGKCRADQ